MRRNTAEKGGFNMKKRKFHLLFMLMGLLMLLSTGMTVSAKTVRVGGVDYRLNRRTCVAWASIDDVRGDHLPTQLYIPRKLRYDNVTYKVKGFSWSSP